MLVDLGSALLHSHGLLSDTEILLVPLLCELITVIDQAISRVDPDVFSTDEVRGPVKLLLLKGHAWVMGQDGDLWQLHPVDIQREGVLSTVDHSHFLNIHCVISQKVVQGEEVEISLERLIVPHDIK